MKPLTSGEPYRIRDKARNVSIRLGVTLVLYYNNSGPNLPHFGGLDTNRTLDTWNPFLPIELALK